METLQIILKSSVCPGVGWGQPGTHIVLAFDSPSLQGRTPSASGVRGAPELGRGRRLEPHAPGDGAGSGDSCLCFTRKTLTCPNVVWDCLKLEEGVSPKDRHAGWVIPAPRRRHLDGGLLPACSPSPACRHGAFTAHGGVRCPTLPACAAHLREKTHCLRCERCHGLPRAPSVPSPGASGTPS